MALDSVGGITQGVLTASSTAPAANLTPANQPTADSAPVAPAGTDATAASSPETVAKQKIDEKKLDGPHLKSVVDKLNDVMGAMDIQLKFSVHRATKTIMVKVVNVQTGETIREIPPKKILDAAAQMMELAGLIVDEKA